MKKMNMVLFGGACKIIYCISLISAVSYAYTNPAMGFSNKMYYVQDPQYTSHTDDYSEGSGSETVAAFDSDHSEDPMGANIENSDVNEAFDMGDEGSKPDQTTSQDDAHPDPMLELIQGESESASKVVETDAGEPEGSVGATPVEAGDQVMDDNAAPGGELVDADDGMPPSTGSGGVTVDADEGINYVDNTGPVEADF